MKSRFRSSLRYLRLAVGVGSVLSVPPSADARPPVTADQPELATSRTILQHRVERIRAALRDDQTVQTDRRHQFVQWYNWNNWNNGWNNWGNW